MTCPDNQYLLPPPAVADILTYQRYNRATMSDLPVELWTEILSQCSNKELCALSCVSPHLLSMVRMVLYRNVELNDSNDDRPFPATFELLRSPPFAVTKYIHSLGFQNLHGLTSSMVPFEHTPHLASLSVIDCPAFIITSNDLQTFVHDINNNCSNLRKLHFDFQHSNLKGNFSISGITHIIWNERTRFPVDRGTLPPFLRSLCEASRLSITNLSIHLGGEPKLKSFFDDIHFPALLSLDTALSHAQQDTHLDLPLCIVDFMSRHHTLQNLRLHYGWHRRSVPTLPLFEKNAIILPRLTHLDAHPALTGLFLEHGAPFMRHLRSLSVTDGIYVLTWHFLIYAFHHWKIYNTERGSGPGSDSVRHLQLLPRVRASGKLYVSHNEFMFIMKNVYTTLPRLEILEVDISDDDVIVPGSLIPTSKLVECFSSFRHLRELCMYSTLTTAYQTIADNRQGSDIVTELAHACSALEVIKIGHTRGVIHTHCLISRDEGGNTKLQYMDVHLNV